MSVHRAVSVLFCLAFVGCGGNGYQDAGGVPVTLPQLIQFRDTAESNTKVDADEQFDLQFSDRSGNSVDLKDYRDRKNVVLVVMRGYSGSFCPLCAAQTSRLIYKYKEFEKRNAEVVVVFPGASEHAQSFVKRLPGESVGDVKTIPFSIVLDENLEMVDRLMIRGDLAKPSTYILDKSGKLRFAYVGTTPSDRPSLKSMLAQLDEIERE